MTNHPDIESDRLMGLIVKYEHNGTAANCQALVRATVVTVPKLIGAYEELLRNLEHLAKEYSTPSPYDAEGVAWRQRAEKAEQALRQYAIGLDGHYVHCPGEKFHGRPEHDCLAIQACEEIRALL